MVLGARKPPPSGDRWLRPGDRWLPPPSGDRWLGLENRHRLAPKFDRSDSRNLSKEVALLASRIIFELFEFPFEPSIDR